jgi:tetratricopeptide (TPR) repeat protein
MGHFRFTRLRFQRTSVVKLAALVLLVPLVGRGQTQEAAANSATVHGTLRDSHGLPLEGASIHLQWSGATQILTVRTDSNGAFQFAGLRAGVYTLQAERKGHGDARFGPFELRRSQTKKVDLTLALKTPTKELNSSSETPQFFDEPQFTVAGATDTRNHGGHGSDTVSRTTQSLAKDVAVLDKNSRPIPPLGSAASAEKALREAADREPASFEANQRLGMLLASSGNFQEALPYLQRAHRIHPEDFPGAYALARAYAELGKYEDARTMIHALLAQQDKSDLHHLLGDVEEKGKNPVEAVHEYQRAAEQDPSEPNLFDWGAELLTHRALEPAVEVFAKGNRLFPQSARMLVGLGVAWYASGSPDLAAKYVCQASDLNPNDPSPYLALGKMQIVETPESQAVLGRLERFARLQPENALANYYYAVALGKKRKARQAPETSRQLESLLEKAVRLDPSLAVGFLQLGALYDEREDPQRAIAAYQQAIAADPQLGEAHYRLAQAYRRGGQVAKAEEEIAWYDQISKKTAEQGEREAREIPQFVYTLRDSKPPVRSP